MTSSLETERTDRAARAASRTVLLAGAALLVAAATAVVLVFRFAQSERERDLQAWQARLAIVADSRLAAVEDWLRGQLGEIRGLAENPSLQLYFAQLAAARDGGDASAELAEAGYLANLLAAVAARSGFDAPPLGPDVAANVPRRGVAGIALLRADGTPLLATAHAPPLEGAQLRFVLSVDDPGGRIGAMYRSVAGTPALAFAVPVYPVQSDPGAVPPVGYVVGLREVGDALFARLRQPGATERTAEGLLVRRAGNAIEYLGPLRDGTAPMALALAADTPGLAARFALETPGGFALRRDYAGNDVLVVARRGEVADFAFLYKVDADEALAGSEARLRRLVVVAVLIVALVSAALVAVWRHASSRRAGEAAARFQLMAERFERQSDVLRLVTDSQPGAIYIADRDGRLHFANAGAAQFAGLPQDDLVGKALGSAFGQEEGRRIGRLNLLALEDHAPQHDARRFDGPDGAHRVVESEHIPLPASREAGESVLVLERDVTAATLEREQRERNLEALIATLVSVVDRRDPYAAHHSARVARVAAAIAAEMDLPERDRAACEIAGRLMNLGKILVPPELLTKTGSLSDAEIRMVRDSILASADLVAGIDFGAPVVETLRQLQERWDGSGYPGGLAGEAIIVPARVVAVANSFVGMASARAFRPGLSVDEATKLLLEQAGAGFDRRIVIALVNHIENRGGREAWADFARPPEPGAPG